MFKKLIFSGVGVLLLIAPLAAAAQTTDYASQLAALQAQIQQLLAQISQLQTQVNAGTPASNSGIASATAGVSASPGASCIQLSHGLYLGVSDAQAGGDVSKLQQFLTQTGDYTYGSVTGYFGPATQAAVQAWQASHGIVSSGSAEATGYGVVGPSTRTAIASGCTTGTGTSGTSPMPPVMEGQGLSATPTSGTSPITVSFTYPHTSDNASNSYSVNFGDGASGSMKYAAPDRPCQVGQACPDAPWGVSHTYQSVGTYTATLTESLACRNSYPACMVPDRLAGTIVIHVTGGTPIANNSLTVTPATGSAPLSVSASFTSGIPCSDAYDLSWGDSSGDVQMAYSAPVSGSACTLLAKINNFQHTYTTAGAYTVTLKTGAKLDHLSTQTVTVSSGAVACTAVGVSCVPGYTTQSYTDSRGCVQVRCIAPNLNDVTFSASPTSGKAPLTVTFTPGSGIDPSSYYAVNFGDGSSASMQQGIITHTYAVAGPYAAQFSSDAACFHASPSCSMPERSYGSVTITVAGSTINTTLSAAPLSGTAPLVVTFSGIGDNISFGDGSGQTCGISATTGTNATAQSCSIGTVTHTYSSAGTYTATSNGRLATITVTAPTTTFTASPTSGPAPLTVSFSGVIGNIDFGDGQVEGISDATNPVAVAHTYANPGSYMALSHNRAVIINVTGNTLPPVQSGGGSAVGGTSQACRVTNIYDELVPGYAFYNLYMDVVGLPTGSKVAITGADSWNTLTFDNVGTESDGSMKLQASQTINSTGINYIMQRKLMIKPISDSGTAITCQPLGDATALPIQSTSASADANANLANALTALQAALEKLLAQLGQ